jgi:hypothetical protein
MPWTFASDIRGRRELTMKLLARTRSSQAGSLTRRFWLGAIQALALAMLIVGIVGVANRAQAVEAFPLDKYPGFGRSQVAAQRDDTIAAWETFRREQAVSSCMARSGFDYVPAVEFPSQPLAAVAKGLRVMDAGSPDQPSPFDRNDAYRAALSGDADERYSRALNGESAADVAETRRSGQLPSGRGPEFMAGGCVGASNAAIPSVWTLKRELEDELESMRQDITASVEIVTTGDAYAECAQRVGGISARGPADVDRLAARDLARPIVVRTVINQCGQVWTVGYRKAEVAAMLRFEERNWAALRATDERYRDVMKAISADDAFLTYLAQYGYRAR